MSQFSEKCKELIEKNDTNVYRMSKAFDLDWTTLQRMKTGKRLPNEDFILRFCDCLQLSASEKKELLELYKIEQLGENTYYSRQCIRQLFSQLVKAPKMKTEADLSTFQYSNTVLSSSTLLQLYSLLDELFQSDEQIEIFTNLPPNNTDFLQQIYNLSEKYKCHLKMTHLFNFTPDSTNSLSNLSVFCQIELIQALTPIAYHPYYTYTHANTSELYSLLFPYYLITKDRLILFSADFCAHIDIHSKTTIQSYTNYFLSILKQARPLVQESIINYIKWQNLTPSPEKNGLILLGHYSAIKTLMKDDMTYNVLLNEKTEQSNTHSVLILHQDRVHTLAHDQLSLPDNMIIAIDKKPTILLIQINTNNISIQSIQESSIYDSLHDFVIDMSKI